MFESKKKMLIQKSQKFFINLLFFIENKSKIIFSKIFFISSFCALIKPSLAQKLKIFLNFSSFKIKFKNFSLLL